ncbi:hypothetical protein D3C87_1176360 [compost metagenome]
MAQGLARGAALDQQLALLAAFPEEPGVVADARQRALGLDRCRLNLGRCLGVGRAEFEDAKQQLAHRLIAAGLFNEVAHHQGDEKASAQGGGFLIANRIQARGVVELFPQAHRAGEAQLGIHRHGGGIAVGFHLLEHLVRVLVGGARRIVVGMQAFHGPYLQHRRRSDQALMDSAQGKARVGV